MMRISQYIAALQVWLVNLATNDETKLTKLGNEKLKSGISNDCNIWSKSEQYKEEEEGEGD